MDIFRLLFTRTFRATIPDRCLQPRRKLCAKILQTGWQDGLVRWQEWTDADVATAGMLLDDLQNVNLVRELNTQLILRRERRRIHGGGSGLSSHIDCPWPGLSECAARLHNADASRDAVVDVVAGATENYVNMFGRLLGIWPFSDLRPFLNVTATEPVALHAMHLIAVHASVTSDPLQSVDHLPGRILYHIYKELQSIAPPETNPEWWPHLSTLEQDILTAVHSMDPNQRFVFSSVAWGRLRLGQIAAAVNERGSRTDVNEVFLTLRSAWQKILPVL